MGNIDTREKDKIEKRKKMTEIANTNVIDSCYLNADISNTDKIMENAVTMLLPVDWLQCQHLFQ